MPVTLSESHSTSESRSVRTAGPTGLDRDARRARGEISCAECRRLKLRCDKKIPCTSCTRRGCAPICPTGTLSAGQGTRLILADTADLHLKITQMADRIRQLESALSEMQTAISSEPHPLLAEPLLSIKRGVDNLNPSSHGEDTRSQPQSSVDQSLVEAFGTITLGVGQEARYFGPAAGPTALLIVGASAATESEEGQLNGDATGGIPTEIQSLPSFLSIGSDANVESTLEILFKYLPQEQNAICLCENYMKYSAFAFRPITRDELLKEYLAPVYAHLRRYRGDIARGPRGHLDFISPHKVSVIFLALSLGALSDPELGPDEKLSALYFRISCCSLAIRSVFDSPERATVQAISMVATYHSTGRRQHSLDYSWVLTQLALVMAHSLGMHRDPEHWATHPTEIQRQRGLFWELTCTDQFYSGILGRPPYVRLSCTDTKFPDDAALSEWEPNTTPYYRWKYEFAKELISLVVKSTLTPNPPPYATIIELDRKAQAKPLPPTNPSDSITVPVHLQQWITLRNRVGVLLFLHRRYFCQVVLTHAADPLRSPFAPSFSATYRMASEIIKSNISDFDHFQRVSSQYWALWLQLFSAAIVMGSIVIRCPHSELGPSAFIELGLACAMFEQGAKVSARAKSGLDVLNKIRNQANQSYYSRFFSGNANGPSADGGATTSDSDLLSDELSTFAGRTFFLVGKDSTPRYSPSTASTTTPSSSDVTANKEDGSAVQWPATSFVDGRPNSDMPRHFVDGIPITALQNEAPVNEDERHQFRGRVPQDLYPYAPAGYDLNPLETQVTSQEAEWQAPFSAATLTQPIGVPLQNHFSQQGDGSHPSVVNHQDLALDLSNEMTGHWMSFVHAFGLSDIINPQEPSTELEYLHGFPFQY